MTMELARRLAAEAIGTALLVLFGAGSLVAAILVGKGSVTYPGIGIVGFSFAIVIAAIIYIFGPVSGAHINPAVTIALTAGRRFPVAEAIPYIFAQMVGALAGGLLVNGIFGPKALTANVSGGTVVQPVRPPSPGSRAGASRADAEGWRWSPAMCSAMPQNWSTGVAGSGLRAPRVRAGRR